MSGLFSQSNLLLYGMQGNNGLLAKTLKKFPKSPVQYMASRFSPLTSAFKVCEIGFELTLIV